MEKMGHLPLTYEQAGRLGYTRYDDNVLETRIKSALKRKNIEKAVGMLKMAEIWETYDNKFDYTDQSLANLENFADNLFRICKICETSKTIAGLDDNVKNGGYNAFNKIGEDLIGKALETYVKILEEYERDVSTGKTSRYNKWTYGEIHHAFDGWSSKNENLTSLERLIIASNGRNIADKALNNIEEKRRDYILIFYCGDYKKKIEKLRDYLDKMTRDKGLLNKATNSLINLRKTYKKDYAIQRREENIPIMAELIKNMESERRKKTKIKKKDKSEEKRSLVEKFNKPFGVVGAFVGAGIGSYIGEKFGIDGVLINFGCAFPLAFLGIRYDTKIVNYINKFVSRNK